MRFQCGPSEAKINDAERRAQAERVARRQWHRWFAWRPVTVTKGDCRFLETIERREVLREGVMWDYIGSRYGLIAEFEYRPCSA